MIRHISFFSAVCVVFGLFLFLAACGDEEPQPPDGDVSRPKPEQPDETTKPERPAEDGDLLVSIIDAAREGKVRETVFDARHSTIKQVKQSWGQPDRVDQAGAGYYVVYGDKGIHFGYNAAGRIFDVRSFRQDLKHVAVPEIKQALGEPDRFTEYKQDDIYAYRMTKNIVLKFIVRSDSKTHHISVFNRAIAGRGDEQVKDPEPYILPIKGRSNQLSHDEWQAMLSWRRHIVDFARLHENVYINGPNQKKVALTFDDGPDARVTPKVIRILERYGVTGNFFFVGSKVKRFPEVVKKAFGNGNLVLNHSYDHEDLTRLGKAEIRAEIERTGEAIASVIGKEPAILRTPFGETDRQVASIARRKGYAVVLWSIDTLDWSQKEKHNIVENVVNHVRNGDIILMHSRSGQDVTAQALPAIIEQLRKKGFEMVGLDELLHIPAYQ